MTSSIDSVAASLIAWAKSVSGSANFAAELVIFLERDRAFSKVLGIPCAPSFDLAIEQTLTLNKLNSPQFEQARRINGDLALARELLQAIQQQNLTLALALYRQLGEAFVAAKMFANVDFETLFKRLEELTLEKADGMALQDVWLEAFGIDPVWFCLQEQDARKLIDDLALLKMAQ